MYYTYFTVKQLPLLSLEYLMKLISRTLFYVKGKREWVSVWTWLLKGTVSPDIGLNFSV
jgi:hypothetical protein